MLFVFHTTYATWADDMVKQLSLREKIGQLCVVAAASEFGSPNQELARAYLKNLDTMKQEVIERLIREYKIGGIIFLMRSTPDRQIALTNHYQGLSKVPLLICLDAEWGLSMRLDGTLRFPRNMTLGAVQDPRLIFDLGKEIGRQCRILGVHMNCAPVVDVNNNPDNPVINDRSFGESKERVALLGGCYAQGIQAAGVLACAKHFPGHGDTAVDSHYALPCIAHPQQRIEALELYPFSKIIKQGVAAVMTAHLLIPAFDQERPASLSRVLLTDLLRKELGFAGLVVSDDLGMGALMKGYSPEEIALQAFMAGTDILLCPGDVPCAIDAIERKIGELPALEKSLDEKVLKVLRAKETAGLHNFQLINDEEVLKNLITEHGKALKKELYRQAITVVRNVNALPVVPSEVTLVQIGGAQGQPFTQQFSKTAYLSAQASRAESDRLLASLQTQTVVVGIFEMNKFASKNFGLSESTLMFIKQLHDLKKQVILSLFGNPYSLRNFGQEAGIVVAYEDDPDAQVAAADVICGHMKAYGRLPISASKVFKQGCGSSGGTLVS